MACREIDLIVIHCSATRTDRCFTEHDLEAAHRRRGFNGCGYHFYIRKNGDIKTMRPVGRIGRKREACRYAYRVAAPFAARAGAHIAAGLSGLPHLRTSGP